MDNPFDAFDTDPSGALVGSAPAGSGNPFDSIPDEPAPAPAPKSVEPSSSKVTTVDNPFARTEASQPEPLPSFPGMIVDDPELHGAFQTLEAYTRQKGTDALNEARGNGFIDGLMDAQQYKETAKGVVPGAIGFVGTSMKGVAGIQTAMQADEGAFARRQLEMFDRIDRGEFVPNVADRGGYRPVSR